MLSRRKPRKNRRKGKKAKRRFVFLGRFLFVFKIIIGLGAVAATSGLFVLIHDVVTQSDYFRAQTITIEGSERLSQKQIADQAQVRKGMNVLAVNLTMVRKKLLAHPWIAEAEVNREIPSGLTIRIKEHAPLAIVDLGHKFLINESGEIFKEWTSGDPDHFPMVTGLQMADIARFDRNDEREAFHPANPLPGEDQAKDAQYHYSPLDAVMHVLRLGQDSKSVLPNRLIKQIRVDREIGLTLHAGTQVGIIKLGYHRYPHKYNMLKHIMMVLNKRQTLPVIDRIDLNNLNRIVVSPRRSKAPSGDDKEV
ncbi:MAG: FtsQ-type POTRA domain-containing protein [Deltaproteobacteria bacterium]|jgi:cell division protein FtsQ|nr:FtsQ-type POTRA domain-containing protein [Deltaproteobacteria bacterium]